MQPEEPQFIGSYQKQKALGRGGMGAVWQVHDTTLNRTMALKIIHQDMAQESDVRSDFEAEAQISAQLQHPGIVPIYEFNTLPNGNLYITMKEIRGRTLRDIIRDVHSASSNGTWGQTEEGWTLRRLIDAFHSVCETMAYAHIMG